MKLEIGSIYQGEIHNRPVKYMGYFAHEDGGDFHQFEYILPSDLPPPTKGGVIGYGQTEEQMLKENYQLQKSCNVLFGKKNV